MSDVSKINIEGVTLDIKDAIARKQIEDILNATNDKTELALFGDSWVDYNSDKGNVRIPQILENQLGVNVHNYSHGGTGFDVPLGYNEQLDEFFGDTSVDKSKVKYVVLVCGLNEYHAGTSASNFRFKLEAWVNRVKAVLDVPVYWFHNYSMQNSTFRPIPTDFYTQQAYYIGVMKSLTCDVITCDCFAWVKEWKSDRYHPNEEGSIGYGFNMVCIINGSTPRTYQYDHCVTYWDSDTVPQAFRAFTVDFFYIGGNLLARIAVPMGGMSVIPNNTSVTFSQPLPCKLVGNRYVSCGCILSGATLSGFMINVMNPAERTWTTQMSGNYITWIETTK